MKKIIALFIIGSMAWQSSTTVAGNIILSRANALAEKALKEYGGYQSIAKDIRCLSSRGGVVRTEQLDALINKAKPQKAPTTTPAKNSSQPAPEKEKRSKKQNPSHDTLTEDNVASEYRYTVGKTTFALTVGDITQEKTEVIVNPANSRLQHAGGVAAAINQAAGALLQPYCATIYKNPIPCGHAVGTPAFNLGLQGVKKIIHTVGPDCRNPEENKHKAELLRQAYTNTLTKAAEYAYKTIALPSLSTGIFGYPVRSATPIAVKTVLDYIRTNNDTFTEVRFVVKSKSDMVVFKRAVDNYRHATEDNENEENSGILGQLISLLNSDLGKALGLVGVLGLGLWLGSRYLQSDERVENNNNDNNNNNN